MRKMTMAAMVATALAAMVIFLICLLLVDDISSGIPKWRI